jgi:hypothetical protein
MNLMKILAVLLLFNFTLGVMNLKEKEIDNGTNEIKATNQLDLGNNSFIFQV